VPKRSQSARKASSSNATSRALQGGLTDKLKHLTNNKKREYSSWRREDRDGNTHGGKSCEQSTYRERKPDAKGHGERKTTHEQAAKNKPCHVHGPESKHSYDECRTNPKNQRSANNNNYNKRAHNAHYNDERYLSSQDESQKNIARRNRAVVREN